VDEDEDPTGRILFAHAKLNPAKQKLTFAYTIEEAVVQDNPRITAPYVTWDPNPVDITADEAVRAASGRGGDRGKAQRALQELLLEILGKGPVLMKEVEEATTEARTFTAKQLRDAREKLGIESFKETGVQNGPWWWRLP
jgi:hypothetical protein